MLDNGKLDATTTERLQHPDQGSVDLSDPDVRFSLDLYIACINSSEATYNNVRTSILQRFPDFKILSHHHAKKMLSDISGVVSVSDDICINSCHAFTGPFSDKEACTICSAPCYTTVNSGRSQRQITRQQMCTIPLEPQIQALR